MLSIRTIAGLVQLLRSFVCRRREAFVPETPRCGPYAFTIDDFCHVLSTASPDALTGLLVEIIGGTTAIRADAPTKYVFDGRLADFRRQLRSDGFEVVDDTLVRLVPAAEPVSQISDHLEDTLTSSGLDDDGEIRRLAHESYSSLTAAQPDYNDATTKARIVLETIARRAAVEVAAARVKPAPHDAWGAALAFLRNECAIEQPEEQALATV